MTWRWTGNKPLYELNVNLVYWCSYASLQPGWVKSISLLLPLVIVVIWLVLSGPVRQPAVLLEKDGRCFLANIALWIFCKNSNSMDFFLAKDHFLFIKLLQIVCMCHVICAFTCTQFYTDYSLDEVKFSCHFKFSWKLFVKWVPGFHISVHHYDEWIPSVSFLHFFPDSKAHWAHVGPTWSRQDPCWANLGPTKFAVGAYCSQAWGSVINWTNIDLF